MNKFLKTIEDNDFYSVTGDQGSKNTHWTFTVLLGKEKNEKIVKSVTVINSFLRITIDLTSLFNGVMYSDVSNDDLIKYVKMKCIKELSHITQTIIYDE